MEKGTVARFPFEIQFISASTTELVRRSSVGSRGRALIVLRAFGKLFAFSYCSNPGSSFQPILTLTESLASVRGVFIFVPSTCTIDRLQSAACKLVGSVPVTKLWVQFYLCSRVAQYLSSEQKSSLNCIFFRVSFDQSRWIDKGPACLCRA